MGLPDERNRAIKYAGCCEPPGVLRKLHDLRGWSYEKLDHIFPRSPRTCRSDGPIASQGLSVAMGNGPVAGPEVWLRSADALRVGQARGDRCR